MTEPGGTFEHDRDWDAFAGHAEAHGADLGRWPSAARALARALIARDPSRAEGVLAAERSLDQLLAFAPDHPPSDALREAVAASFSAKRPWRGVDVTWLRWCVRQPALSGAAALAVCAGLLVGATMSGGVLTAARQDALAGAVQSELPSGGDLSAAGPT